MNTSWWGGGFPWYLPLPPSGVVQVAKEESGAGAIRSVPGFIHEEILEGKMGEYLEYTLKRKMFMPISYHRGRVNFYSAGPNCTRVVWEVSYTPYPLIGQSGMKMFVSTFDLFFLPALKSEAEKNSPSKPKPKTTIVGWIVFLLKLFLFFYVVFVGYRLMRLPGVKPQTPGTEYLAMCAQHRLESSSLTDVLKNQVFLVIGGTGFTGSALVEELRQRGLKVKVLGRSLPPNPEYPYANGGSYPVQGVEYIKGDMSQLEDLRRAMKGTTVVFQTATSYGFPLFGSKRNYEQTELANFEGMKRVMQAAAESKTVKQVIYTSSCDTVFSGRNLWRANETHPYLEAFGSSLQYAEKEFEVGDHYAKTKILAEKYVLAQDNKVNGIRTVSLRPNGIYGPGEFFAFRKAVDPAYLLGFFPLYFDETQETDWSCVHNVVYAHLLASAKLIVDPDTVGGKAYFITDDEVTNSAAHVIFKPAIEAAAGPLLTWIKLPPWILPQVGEALEVVEKFIFEQTGYSLPHFINRKLALKAITSHTHDNSRARKDLGYKPLMTTKQCQDFTAEEMKRRYNY